MEREFDCIIVGGGIAGLQAGIQLGRYNRKTVILDANEGRSNLCRNYRNILGWPDGVSGEDLRQKGRIQAERVGVQFLNQKAIKAENQNDGFIITTDAKEKLIGKTLLMATGVTDRLPDIKNIKTCLGATMFICPDCDGYEVQNKKVIVLGSGEAGANMATTLHYWASSIIYINHEQKRLEPSREQELTKLGIDHVQKAITEVLVKDEAVFEGVVLDDGTTIKGDRAFVAFGGNRVHSELAEQLGVQLENKHIIVNARTKETNIKNVWAAGDVAAHSEQVTIAMGDGVQAAIWIQKELRRREK
ncbi:Thioredoxin reductase [Fictibacillus enclensis]|uniref:Pyridine nucleotide-disulfide oxidoreductase n=1 Tax=Fictibacillus enclensis TaxID=1017270 RepID=A0A0V8JEG2_9BACL|nr:NAD(P)/FAD-dependent oxidoreductase [Fictibacillus enclensis]KSU85338.1 pyridine nucleotide-disulfide oxidoreductase [Fictibacillus enclensis]SCB95149.1 Thioredoxin reductase [Fictibacillus enclensis]